MLFGGPGVLARGEFCAAVFSKWPIETGKVNIGNLC